MTSDKGGVFNAPVQTYPDIFESLATFSFGYHYHPHVSGRRIRKSHLNPLSRVEIFEYANSNIDLARAESEALVDISFYSSLKQNLKSRNAKRRRQQKTATKISTVYVPISRKHLFPDSIH